MNSFARGFKACVAAALCAALAACASDPITSNVRPLASDKALSEHAPAGAYGALLRIGEATRQAGNPGSAVLFFRRAHAADPFKPAPLVGLGLSLNQLAQYNEAAQAFRDAIDLDHNNTEAMRGLASALIGLDQPLLAIDQLNAANAIHPDYRNLNSLGVAYDRLGQHQKAQDYYEQGLKLYPNNLSLLNNLGLSQILSRDYDGAIKTLIDAAQQPGATARQRQNLALAYGLAGETADAARISRLDLSNEAVQSNLAYYGILRAVDDRTLTAAIMGIDTPMKPASGPPAKAAMAQPAPRADMDLPARGRLPETSMAAPKPAVTQEPLADLAERAAPVPKPETAPAFANAENPAPKAERPMPKAETPAKLADADVAEAPRRLTPKAATRVPATAGAPRATFVPPSMAAVEAQTEPLKPASGPEPVPSTKPARPDKAVEKPVRVKTAERAAPALKAAVAPARHEPPVPVAVVPVVTAPEAKRPETRTAAAPESVPGASPAEHPAVAAPARAVAETAPPAPKTEVPVAVVPVVTEPPAPVAASADEAMRPDLTTAAREPAPPAPTPAPTAAEPVSVIPVATEAPAAMEAAAIAPEFIPPPPPPPAAVPMTETAAVPAPEGVPAPPEPPAEEPSSEAAIPVAAIPVVTEPEAGVSPPPAPPVAVETKETVNPDSVLGIEPQAGGEATAPTGGPSRVVITGLADQKPITKDVPAVAEAHRKLAFPVFRDEPGPSYASPAGETGQKTANGRTFSSKLYDFFFKPMTDPESVAKLPPSARFAPMKPASGPEAVPEEWGGGVANSYRARRDAIPSRPPAAETTAP